MADNAGQADASDKAAVGKDQAKPQDWNAEGMKTADALAAKVRAAGMKCDDYEPTNFRMLQADYEGKIPVAIAMASCNSDFDEDLTFEVFEDAAQARQFIDGKRELLCRKAANMKLDSFPGFAYVYGGAWIIEPDEKETAEKLAPIVGGKAGVASCKK
jgi:hypothetical protein